MATAVDFAATLIDPAAIKGAGHSAVLAYVSPSRPGSNFGAKPIPRSYADACKREGLEVVSIWQYGKPGNEQSPSDWTTGREGGRRMARVALDQHFAAGGPGYRPIFFAVDEDITLNQWNNGAVEFFRGVADVLGPQWVGIYGSSKVCAWAIEDGVVGRTSEGKYWAWQTKAWSGGVVTDGIVLFQRVVDTPSNPGPKIDGSAVDVNDILAGDYGQWSAAKTESRPPVTPVPEFRYLDLVQGSFNSREGARVTNFLLHTQEGNGTAESLAGYLNNRNNGVSYHYTLRDGVLAQVVPENMASWSVLSANPFTVNLCFAGSRAGWSREQWLEIEDDIKIAAWLGVKCAREHGFEAQVIAPPYFYGDGISDHNYVTQELGIGNHTDVGPNFPWDVLSHWVDVYKGTVQEEDDIMAAREVENYLGIPVGLDFMLAWIDKREARNEALLSALLDKVAGEGTAKALLSKFDEPLPPKFKG